MSIATKNINAEKIQGNLSITSVSATTYYNLPPSSGSSVSGDYLPLSGGTVSGNTVFQSGLTANTISATTYFNLPVTADTFVTGFTLTNNQLLTISQNRTDQYSAFTLSLSAVTGTTYRISGLTANTIVTDYIDFNTGATVTGQVARLTWNNTDGTLDLGLKGGNVTLQIGQEEVIRVVNKTGADLLESEYKVVRIRKTSEGGAQGQRLAVVLSQADNDANSVDTIGVVTENITNNEEGFITSSGLVRGINTTGSLQGETWSEGDVLYLSPFSAGTLTNIKPQAPDHTIIVAFVVFKNSNNGKIFVKVDNGYEIDELHNVRITNPQQNDILQYSAGTYGVWYNTGLPTLNSLTVTGQTRFTDGFTSSTLTVTGNTSLQGLTSTTISATTYLNVNAVTGGSFSNNVITLSGTGNVNGVQITGFTSGGGEVNTASNLGSGTGLFATKSGVDLQFKSLTSTGNTVTITNNSTTVNLESSSPGGGFTWNSSNTTQSMTADNGYVTTGSTLTTFTLPSTIAFGKTVEIAGNSTGLWRLNQNSGQQIRFGNTATTVTSGILSATSQGDCIKLICVSADTLFIVTSSMGNIFFS